MIIEYKTHELTIAGAARKYSVFNTYTDGHRLALKGVVFTGSLPQCKAFIDGYLHAHGE